MGFEERGEEKEEKRRGYKKTRGEAKREIRENEEMKKDQRGRERQNEKRRREEENCLRKAEGNRKNKRKRKRKKRKINKRGGERKRGERKGERGIYAPKGNFPPRMADFWRENDATCSQNKTIRVANYRFSPHDHINNKSSFKNNGTPRYINKYPTEYI